MVHARSVVVNSLDARAGRAGDLQGALDKIALVEGELRIKDVRMAKIDPHRRPCHRSIERMAILELKAARGWWQAETARRFLVKPTTVASWLKRIDESDPTPSVQMHEPVNKFPDLVRYVARRLKVPCPSIGRKRIAQTLTRAGLRLSASTVGRALQHHARDPERPTDAEAVAPAEHRRIRTTDRWSDRKGQAAASCLACRPYGCLPSVLVSSFSYHPASSRSGRCIVCDAHRRVFSHTFEGPPELESKSKTPEGRHARYEHRVADNAQPGQRVQRRRREEVRGPGVERRASNNAVAGDWVTVIIGLLPIQAKWTHMSV